MSAKPAEALAAVQADLEFFQEESRSVIVAVLDGWRNPPVIRKLIAAGRGSA